MDTALESLIDEFEAGRLTRRQLTAGLALLVGGAALAAGAKGASAQQGTGSTFRAWDVNHEALSVADVQRSRDFYVRHLGLEVTSESARNCFLSCEGDNFLALFQSANPGLNHYCFSVDGYAVGDAAEKLRARGFQPRVTGNRIYFPDPDGIEVQLAAPNHKP